MKTSFRVVALGLGALTLALCAGCEEDRLNAEIPTFAFAAPVVADVPADPVPAPAAPAAPTSPNTPPAAAPVTPATAEPPKPATPAAAETKAAPASVVSTPPGVPATVATTNATNIVRTPIAPESVNLSPALAEVVKLAHAGVTEDVLMAYITNSARLYDIGSNEILYLHDLGVSSNVITALIQRSVSPDMLARKQAATAVKPLPPGVGLSTPATNVYPPKILPQPPEPTPVNPPEAPGVEGSAAIAPAAPTVVQEPIVVQEPVTISYFQTELAPYGSWLDVPGYGSCWRPTVAVCNSSWRPYADHGRWLWTDCGWYWYSDYSWGWAPFHYGRWTCPTGIGWVWAPDTCWGPSWVSWRYTSSYCGWAPLPPSACYVPGRGFYHNTLAVGFGFDFGLAAWHYTYLPTSRFCDRRPYHYYVSQSHGKAIHKDSTVINNYVAGNNNTIINHGVGFDRVAKVTRGDVRQVALKDTTAIRDLGPRRERLETDGRTLAVARPNLAASRISPPVKPITATSGLQPRSASDASASINGGGAGAGYSQSGAKNNSSGKAPRFNSRPSVSGSASAKGTDSAASDRPRVFRPSTSSGGAPTPSAVPENSVAKPRESVTGGSTPRGSIIIKPTSPILQSGKSSGVQPVPSWMANPQPPASSTGTKSPVFRSAPPAGSAPAPSSAAPLKAPAPVTTRPQPAFAQPSGIKAPTFRSAESPQPRLSAPAPRYQPAPSAPAAPRPSYAPIQRAPSAPRMDSGRSYSVPRSAPASPSRGESSPRSSSPSRSSGGDYSKQK